MSFFNLTNRTFGPSIGEYYTVRCSKSPQAMEELHQKRKASLKRLPNR